MPMAGDTQFDLLLKRVREGDQDAATELVRLYEPEVKRTVHAALSGNARLRQAVDSTDICQSVLGQFFVRVAAGEFDLDDSGDLVKLLVTMAKNRIVDRHRKESAARRDRGRQQALGGGDSSPRVQIAAPGATPSRVAAGRELLAKTLALMDPDERRLAEERAHGRSWKELAVEFGESADSLRMRLSRAIDRVAREIEL